jgi:hypothetical protein
MGFRCAVLVSSVAIAALFVKPVRADVLLVGKTNTPVDHGNGDMVGDEIRWIGCDGQKKTIRHPPYILYKRPEDCKGLGPVATTGPAPDLFGLKCKGSSPLFRDNSTQICAVADKKLAQHFFSNAEKGENVRFTVQSGKITLHSADNDLVLEEGKWEDFHKSPSSPQ